MRKVRSKRSSKVGVTFVKGQTDENGITKVKVRFQTCMPVYKIFLFTCLILKTLYLLLLFQT